MTFVSHAQNFEDVLLWRALGHIENGSYLDVGAQDPDLDSVSLTFYERGWRGIHVEPTPAYAEKLRKARPGETVIQAAVGNGTGLLTLFEFPDTGLSTGIADIAAMHSAAGLASQPISVPQISLASIFDEFADRLIHWMKVDVEGMEHAALKSWGAHPARPWIVLIEATLPNSRDQTHEAWQHELFERGYAEILFDGLNRWYLSADHLEFRDSLLGPPCFFDGFQVACTHFSAKHVRESSEQDLENAAAVFAVREDQLRAEAADALADLESRLNTHIAVLQEERESQAVLYSAQLELVQAERNDWQQRHDSLQAELVDLMRAATEERRLASEAERLRLELAAAERDEQSQRMEGLRHQLEDLQHQLAVSQEESRHAQADAGQRLQQLHEADSLIARALAEPAGRWQRLGRFLGIDRSDRLRQVLLGGLTGKTLPIEEDNMAMLTTTQHRNPYLRADSLKELLEWNDVDFVRCAYVTILGRQPDPSGEGHFTDRLRRGDSKYAILWNLRHSDEGRNHDPGIAGLDRTLKREAFRRNRYIGWLGRFFLRGEGLSKHDRRFRELRNTLAVISLEQARQSQALVANQNLGGELIAKLDKIAGNLAQLTDHVAAMNSRGSSAEGSGDPSLSREGDRPVRVTDDIDLSSRERTVLHLIQSAKY